MNMVALCGIVLLAAILCVLLRKYHAEYSIIISLAAGILVLAIVLSRISPAISQIQSLLTATKLSSEYGLILFKALGICFLTQFSADSCRDAGESALASKIELAGKIAIVILALPLFEKIAQTAITLIGG